MPYASPSSALQEHDHMHFHTMWFSANRRLNTMLYASPSSALHLRHSPSSTGAVSMQSAVYFGRSRQPPVRAPPQQVQHMRSISHIWAAQPAGTAATAAAGMAAVAVWRLTTSAPEVCWQQHQIQVHPNRSSSAPVRLLQGGLLGRKEGAVGIVHQVQLQAGPRPSVPRRVQHLQALQRAGRAGSGRRSARRRPMALPTISSMSGSNG
jgi:hypothetical protein